MQASNINFLGRSKLEDGYDIKFYNNNEKVVAKIYKSGSMLKKCTLENLPIQHWTYERLTEIAKSKIDQLIARSKLDQLFNEQKVQVQRKRAQREYKIGRSTPELKVARTPLQILGNKKESRNDHKARRGVIKDRRPLTNRASSSSRSGNNIEPNKEGQATIPLLTAAKDGELAIVKRLLMSGGSITGEDGCNEKKALSIAAFKFCELFQQFLNTGMSQDTDWSHRIPSFKELVQCINNFWYRLWESEIPVWQLFSEPTVLKFAVSCLTVFKHIRKRRADVIDNGFNNRAEVFDVIWEKLQMVNVKTPSTEQGECLTHKNENIEPNHHSEVELIAERNWTTFMTVADGACAQHAALGEQTERGYFFQPKGGISCREDFCNRLLEQFSGNGFQNEKIQAAYLDQMQGLIRDIGTAFIRMVKEGKVSNVEEFLMYHPFSENDGNTFVVFEAIAPQIELFLDMICVEEQIIKTKQDIIRPVVDRLNAIDRGVCIPGSMAASSSSSSSSTSLFTLSNFCQELKKGLTEVQPFNYLLLDPEEMERRLIQIEKEELDEMVQGEINTIRKAIRGINRCNEDLEEHDCHMGILSSRIALEVIEQYLGCLLEGDGNSWHYWFSYNEMIMIAHLYNINIKIYEKNGREEPLFAEKIWVITSK